ncbi:hypothetical protein ABBQ38_009524 [Trebouxia sp. C0009 RCD-2024]
MSADMTSGEGLLLTGLGLMCSAIAEMQYTLHKDLCRYHRQVASAKPINSLSDLVDLRPQLPLYVAVKGKASLKKTAKLVKIESSTEEAVLLQTEATQHVRRQYWRLWTFGAEKSQYNTITTDWKLDDDSGFCLPVIDAQQADMLPLVDTGLHFIPETKLNTLFRTVMNLGGATAPQYELVGTQKESKGLLLGTQLHAFGEAATERDGRVVLRRPRNDKPFIISDMPGKEIIAHEKFMAQLCKANAWLVGSVGLLLLGSQVVQLGRVIWRAKLNWVLVMDQFCLTTIANRDQTLRDLLKSSLLPGRGLSSLCFG